MLGNRNARRRDRRWCGGGGVTTAAPSRASQATSTVELFASFGIAVFPGPYGEKGSRAKDWPRIDFRTAREMTLAELGRHDANLVLRTGPELGAIDIDGKGGVNPSAALERLLGILPDGVAAYRASRGFGVLLKPKRVLGDGLLPAYGAELFTAGHLVNIPPSRHPSGIDYEWVIPPGVSSRPWTWKLSYCCLKQRPALELGITAAAVVWRLRRKKTRSSSSDSWRKPVFSRAEADRNCNSVLGIRNARQA